MDLTERNKAVFDKHKLIVVSTYNEPGIDGHFDDCTKEVLKLKGFEVTSHTNLTPPAAVLY